MKGDTIVFFFSSKRKEKKQAEKKNIEKKKICKKRRELTFFSHFYIWDETLFFNVKLSTFFKPCVSRLLEALCYSSSKALLSSGDGMNEK
jgi:hypothetical protein